MNMMSNSVGVFVVMHSMDDVSVAGGTVNDEHTSR